MLADIISEIGVRKLARECGVSPAAPVRWKTNGLPNQPKAQRAHYERCIAKLSGIKVDELRKQLKAEEAAKAA